METSLRDKYPNISEYFPLDSIESVVALFRFQLTQNPDPSGVPCPDLALLSIVLGLVEDVLTTPTVSDGQTASSDGNTAPETQPQTKSRSPKRTGYGNFTPIKLSTVELYYQKFLKMLLTPLVGNEMFSYLEKTVEGDSSGKRKKTSTTDTENASGANTTDITSKFTTDRIVSLKTSGTISDSSMDLRKNKTFISSRVMVKKVSDIIWSALSSSYYKDRAHIQSLYSLLTSSRLDCFGVAACVVAGCQVLGMSDVHLCLSEDHAWVSFGQDGDETAEVTWHGKAVEDKRGESVALRTRDKGWLYLGGHAVKCSRVMEVAALVSSINPSISTTLDSKMLSQLQQSLLWLLHDLNHLERYPMALCNIGDIEELSPTPGRPSPELLFHRAINISRQYYGDAHVYPHTYLGGYLYRMGRYREALCVWANATAVISKYNYQKDDQEVYKEFLEIANEIIPQIIKMAADSNTSCYPDDPSTTFLSSSECCAYLFKFYDGLCEWEEGSSTPVLHITWATHMIYSVSRFDPKARASINIECVNVDDEEEGRQQQQGEKFSGLQKKEKKSDRDGVRKDVGGLSCDCLDVQQADSTTNEAIRSEVHKEGISKVSPGLSHSSLDSTSSVLWPGMDAGHEEVMIKSLIDKISSQVQSDAEGKVSASMAALTQACGESVLNPDYLLGCGQPFTIPSASELNKPTQKKKTSYAATIKESLRSETKLSNDGKLKTEPWSPGFGTKVSSTQKALGMKIGGDEILEKKEDLKSMKTGLVEMLESKKSSQLGSPASQTKMDLSKLMVSVTQDWSESLSPGKLGSFSPTFAGNMIGEMKPSSSDISTLSSLCRLPLVMSPREEVGPLTCAGVEVEKERRSVQLFLRSAKMKEIKDLLVAPKLNASAIKLQLTAQSQVQSRQSRRSGGLLGSVEGYWKEESWVKMAGGKRELEGARSSRSGKRTKNN